MSHDTLALMVDTEQKPVFLVDGSSYIFRAYHALPSLSTHSGLATGAIYGVAQMLTRLLNDYELDQVGVIFDAPGKTFRHELYPEYKANRPEMPEDLAQQIPYIHSLTEAFGLPILSEAGVEADDVIGTLATQAEGLDQNVVIVTADKDMAQLVDTKICLLDTAKDEVIDVERVIQRYGVPPLNIPDHLALVGDPSDNIPGVPGIGAKTATKLITAYGSVDNLLAHLDELQGKQRAKLEAYADQLRLSRNLVTIRRQLELTHRLNELERSELNHDRLRELLLELEFHSLIRSLKGHNSRGAEASPQYHKVTRELELTELINRLGSTTRFAFDTETTSLQAVTADLVGLAFTVETGSGYYIPVGHTGHGSSEQLPYTQVLDVVRPILAQTGICKIGHNLKYDLNVLSRAGIEVAGPFQDTLLLSYVLNPSRHHHDLDTVARERLGRYLTPYSELAGQGAKKVTFDRVSVDQATPYAGEDAETTLTLADNLLTELQQSPRLYAIYTELDLPLMPILAKVERTGVRLDAGLLEELGAELAAEMESLRDHAYTLAGTKFNLNSPKQIQAILYEDNELPVLKRTPKGAPSTAEEVLSQLAIDYPLPAKILEYRALAKLKSTYIDTLPRLVNPETGRVHTHYHQATTATGRLSSSDPNLQNIPIRTERGRRIRRAFVPETGWVMVAADYSQIELRLMAHISGDARLRQAFALGEDIHAATAAEVFGASGPEQIAPEQRRAAKTINFGLIYGMSAFGLAQQLEISREEAQSYIDAYFARYPGVYAYMGAARQQAHNQGYVETLRGRRLYLPDIHSRTPAVRAAAERAAINAPVQGSAADTIKQAMINVDDWLIQSGLQARLLMQVHDELVLECPFEETQRLKCELPTLMTQGTELEVPLEVEVGIGMNWEEAH